MKRHNEKEKKYDVESAHNRGVSVKDIAKNAGLGRKEVREQLEKAGFEIDKPENKPKSLKKIADKKWLIDQYIKKGKSPQVIADEIGVSRNLVSRAIKNHDIPKRGMTASQANRSAK